MQQAQVPRCPRQRNHARNPNKRRELNIEAAKLNQHVKNVDRLIVEGAMRQLVEDQDSITYGKFSQKERKQMKKDKVKNLADQLQGIKLQDDKPQDGI